MVDIKLESKEIRYALGGIGLILFWFLVARPAIAPTLQNFPPILAMFIFQIGLFAGLLLLSSFLNGNMFHMRFSLITFTVLIGINILSPPYVVTQNGVIHTEVDYWFVSADGAFASFWSGFLPPGLVWAFTYIVSPVLLLVIIPILITDPGTIRRALHV